MTTASHRVIAESSILPVANGRTAWRHLRRHLAAERRMVVVVLGFQVVASAAGLVGPQLLEHVINEVGWHHGDSVVTTVVVLFAAALVIQTVLTSAARGMGAVIGERVLARLREGLVTAVLDLPLGLVERAGTGDLLTRASTDVDDLSNVVRQGLPQFLVAAVTAVLAVAALVWTAPVLGLVLLPVTPMLAGTTRWYLKRARPAYQQEMAAYAQVNAVLSETVSAGRTVEALQLGERRTAQVDDDIAAWIGWERATLRLRTVYFGWAETAYVVPLVLCLGVGGLLHLDHHLSVGAVAAAALYAQQLVVPVDTLLAWGDEIQVAGASLARVLGVSEVPLPVPSEERPADERLVAEAVRFAYRGERDVLHGIDLAPEPGSRLAIVGPSGAGKSTLALLLAGIHPPRDGTVEVGGVAAHRLPPERLRREVALVTQEHHLFACSLRDNLRMARPEATDDQLWWVLEVVDAAREVAALLEGMDTRVGSAGLVLGPGLAQQIAVARLLLADPHTLVLDEATSLLDSRSARRLERSVARLLEGRTVIAVSHRLHAAHDATTVAVVEGGLLSELGSHAELLAAGGPYARLWHSWQGDGATG